MLPASMSRALVPRVIISDAKSIVWGVGRGASQCCHTTLCEACKKILLVYDFITVHYLPPSSQLLASAEEAEGG